MMHLMGTYLQDFMNFFNTVLLKKKVLLDNNLILQMLKVIMVIYE